MASLEPGVQARDDSNAIEECLGECLLEEPEQQAEAVERACLRHPELAPGLRERFARLVDFGLAGAASEIAPLPELLGDFVPLEHLGAGGMGVVYRARQVSLSREVALKLVRPDHAYFPGARERFRREAEAVARLAHPGIVPVFAVGETRGAPWFAMELVEGCTLAELLLDLQGRDATELAGPDLRRVLEQRCGRPARADVALFGETWVRAVLELALQAAEALDHAHRRGIVHRDVKPSNLMLDLEGRLRLFDFGLTHRSDERRLTHSGAQPGTLPYMAPEQVRGEPVDARVDVYALGLTLRELLTLRATFEAPSMHVLQSDILAGRAPSPRSINPRIPRDVEAVCLTACEVDPQRRYRSAADLAEDLRAALAGRPVAARRPGPARVAVRLVVRHPAWSLGAVLALSLLGGLPGALWWQARGHARRLGVSLANEQQARADEGLAARGLADALARERAALAQETLAREDAEAMLNVLGNVLLETTPERSGGAPLTSASILERGVASLPLLADRPTVQGVYLRTLGDAFRRTGQTQRAVEVLEAAVEAERTHRPGATPALMLALNSLGTAQQLAGRLDAARATFEEGLEVAAQLVPPDETWNATLHNNLGGVLYSQLEFAAAALELRAALEAYLRLPQLDVERVATARSNLAAALIEGGDAREARSQAEAAAKLLAGDGALEAIPRAHQLNSIAIVFSRTEAPERALELLDEAIGLLTQRYPDGDLYLACVHFNRGTALELLQRPDEALSAFEHAVDMMDALGLSDSPDAVRFRERFDELARRR